MAGRPRDNPSEQKKWRTDLYERLWVRQSLLIGDAPRQEVIARIDLKDMEKFCFLHADTILMARNLEVDVDSREKVARAIGSATQQASLELEKRSRGAAQWPAEDRRGVENSKQAQAGAKAKVTLSSLLDGWAAEKRPAERTIYEWQRVLLQFKAFLKHEDASRITVDDVIRWKASMVEAGLKAKTIKDGKLAPMRAILQWGAKNRKIASNPAERVTIESKQKRSEAKRSFTDEEAAIILRAAALSTDPVKRWVPTLCAYSGARLSEVCQLRTQDIRLIEGVWCMAFDPEAGSLKTESSERAVPLHPVVLDSGFLEFVATAGGGPLFKSLPLDKFGRRGGNGTKVLGRWVRRWASRTRVCRRIIRGGIDCGRSPAVMVWRRISRMRSRGMAELSVCGSGHLSDARLSKCVWRF